MRPSSIAHSEPRFSDSEFRFPEEEGRTERHSPADMIGFLGLACGIWTANTPRALRVGRAIAAGTIWINTYKQFSISTPFGGFKASGLGREKGRAGLLAYMNQKSYYLDLSEAPHPWAT